MKVVKFNPKQTAAEALVKRLQPAGLDTETSSEWHRVGLLLASLDRLRPHYVDTITEYCHATVRLRKLRAMFKSLDDEFITSGGRYGLRIRAHPALGEISEAWRQWASLARHLGFTPASDRALQDRRSHAYASVVDTDDDDSEFA